MFRSAPMVPTRRQVENNATFRRLKPGIDETYPQGRYVAIDDGRILADAATFPELDTALRAMGHEIRQVLVVQAGTEYSEHVTILSPVSRR
jgi:hypothetical protein